MPVSFSYWPWHHAYPALQLNCSIGLLVVSLSALWVQRIAAPVPALEGETRHVSKREQAVDAIAAACTLVPRLNAMTFSGAANEVHRSVNRANIGTIRGSLSREFHDWRPPQVADFVRLSGTVRYAPSQNQSLKVCDSSRPPESGSMSA